jgi:hypothetical protein
MATDRATSATASLTDALSRFQSLGALIWQARTLEMLGLLHSTSGDQASAVEVWRQAVELVRDVEPRVSTPLTAAIHDRLDRLPARPSGLRR